MPGKPKYTDSDLPKFQAKIDAYFEDCQKRETLPSIPGLAFCLGYATRQSLNELVARDNNPLLKDATLRAKLCIETLLNERTMERYTKNITGPIFALKALYSYQDKKQVELIGKVETIRLPDKVEEGAPLE